MGFADFKRNFVERSESYKRTMTVQPPGSVREFQLKALESEIFQDSLFEIVGNLDTLAVESRQIRKCLERIALAIEGMERK